METKNENEEKKDSLPESQQEVNEQYDQLTKDAEEDIREKKPGSQSNHSQQHNNGRGGGK